MNRLVNETNTSNMLHLLDLDDYSQENIERLLNNAEKMLEILERDVKKTSYLRGKTIITLFFESSTRTRVSFEQAGKILGADVINVTEKGSSKSKGESFLNTALTLQAMKADIIIVRHPHSGAPNFLANRLNTSIINAGDGAHAHPSQSLLDLFTLRKNLGELSGKKIAIVGDILYSRVARSNLWGLTKMGANLTICGPTTLIPTDFIHKCNQTSGHPFSSVRVEPDLRKALANADAIMVLRLQQERQIAGHIPSIREYSRYYGINADRLKFAKDSVILMHPGPMNEGVEIETDVAHGTHSVIQDQVNYGVAIRMAILEFLIANQGQY